MILEFDETNLAEVTAAAVNKGKDSSWYLNKTKMRIHKNNFTSLEKGK